MYAMWDKKWLPRLKSTTIYALFLDEDEVLGIEDPKKQLLKWIESARGGVDVISVVGMGGLGKTTLAKKVYGDDSVKHHFDRHAWLVASNYKDVKRLLISLVKKFVGEIKDAPPQGIEHLTNLEYVGFHDMPIEFKNMVVEDQRRQGDDWRLAGVRYVGFSVNTNGHREVPSHGTIRSNDVKVVEGSYLDDVKLQRLNWKWCYVGYHGARVYWASLRTNWPRGVTGWRGVSEGMSVLVRRQGPCSSAAGRGM